MLSTQCPSLVKPPRMFLHNKYSKATVIHWIMIKLKHVPIKIDCNSDTSTDDKAIGPGSNENNVSYVPIHQNHENMVKR